MSIFDRFRKKKERVEPIPSAKYFHHEDPMIERESKKIKEEILNVARTVRVEAAKTLDNFDVIGEMDDLYRAIDGLSFHVLKRTGERVRDFLIYCLAHLPYRELDAQGTRAGIRLINEWVRRFNDTNNMGTFANDTRLPNLAMAEYGAAIQLSRLEYQTFMIQEKVRTIKKTMEEGSVTTDFAMDKLKALKSEYVRLEEERKRTKTRVKAAGSAINLILYPDQANENLAEKTIEEISLDNDLFPSGLKDAPKEEKPSEGDDSNAPSDQILINF